MYTNLTHTILFLSQLIMSCSTKFQKHKKHRHHHKHRKPSRRHDEASPSRPTPKKTPTKSPKPRHGRKDKPEERQRGERWTEAKSAACMMSAIPNRDFLKAKLPIDKTDGGEIADRKKLTFSELLSLVYISDDSVTGKHNDKII